MMEKKIKTIKTMIDRSDNADEKKALKAALRAMNSRKPRPPIYEQCDSNEPIIIICPTCDNELDTKYYCDYCPACGQALEWGKYFDGGMIQ